MFIIRPDDPPMQRMLDKLAAAGWIEGTITVDKATPSDPHAGQVGIKWTDEGRSRMAVILELIHQIEQSSMPLSNDEIQWLKSLAEFAAMSGGPNTPPSRH